jgi:hypothetical protein
MKTSAQPFPLTLNPLLEPYQSALTWTQMDFKNLKTQNPPSFIKLALLPTLASHHHPSLNKPLQKTHPKLTLEIQNLFLIPLTLMIKLKHNHFSIINPMMKLTMMIPNLVQHHQHHNYSIVLTIRKDTPITKKDDIMFSRMH